MKPGSAVASVCATSALPSDALFEHKTAKFLARNELTRPKQLKEAGHPKEWLGAYDLSEAELEQIKGLREVPQSLLGCALPCCCQIALKVGGAGWV